MGWMVRPGDRHWGWLTNPQAREIEASPICTLYHQNELNFSTFRRRAKALRYRDSRKESNLFINFLTLAPDFVI